MCAAKELLERKERLGRRASYSVIGRKIGRDKKSVWQAMTGEEGPIVINRDVVLKDVDRALTELESEQDEVAA